MSIGPRIQLLVCACCMTGCANPPPTGTVACVDGCAPARADCEQDHHICLGPFTHDTYRRGYDRCVTRGTARGWAKDAYEALPERCRGSSHFEQGFSDAFVAIAEGSDGQLPAVPPARYWHAKYRTCPGHVDAAEWYRGYAAGVQAAHSTPYFQCRDIFVPQHAHDPTHYPQGIAPPGIW